MSWFGNRGQLPVDVLGHFGPGMDGEDVLAEDLDRLFSGRRCATLTRMVSLHLPLRQANTTAGQSTAQQSNFVLPQE